MNLPIPERRQNVDPDAMLGSCNGLPMLPKPCQIPIRRFGYGCRAGNDPLVPLRLVLKAERPLLGLRKGQYVYAIGRGMVVCRPERPERVAAV